jgi:hypothetical protein
MKLSKLVAGLRIAAPYYDDQDGYHIGAEHDQLYLYKTDQPMSSEDVAKMRELGWFQPDSEEDAYDPEDGWSAFT